MSKQRKRRGRTIEPESPVTSTSTSPTKQPPSKKQKTNQNETVRTLAISEINGRFTTNVVCRVQGIVLTKEEPQEMKGKYGRFQLSQFTMVDMNGKAIDVKSYKQKALADANKYEKFREVEVVFSTKDVSRTDLRYNRADNKYYIKNPVRVTMTPMNVKTKLSTMKFSFKTIEEMQNNVQGQVTKNNICGIVTEIMTQQFQQREGLMIRINDASGSQRHVFYERNVIDATLIKKDGFIFIWNANVQEKEGYINADGGIPLDPNAKQMLRMQEK